MITQPLNKSSNFRFAKPDAWSTKDTAWHIFHKDAVHVYEIDYAHFKAMNGTMNQPIVGRYNEAEMGELTRQSVPTAGCIWTLVTQYIDGATIRFPSHKTAALIYKAIANHIDAHLVAMRTDKMYESPNADDFRYMTEFAVAIRPQAMLDSPDIDNKAVNHLSRGMLPTRASFSRVTVEEDKVKKPDVPKVTQKMD